MGDIADMMLEGLLCECCGAFIDGDSDGVPRRCGDCARYDEREARSRSARKPQAQKTNCPTCNRRVKLAGLADHQRDAHGVKGTT
ncbi:hypothetical protein SAMD00023378_3938 [Ralstonia sp. NT80]|uniref:hypothetical protein n=1 Tax=Ralstonia sp. NT80 TaxID=1218247 RepID=UPI00073E8268|nr:hypothetical protein [Ralstonia sp. NT80]GAQ30255.1 hypothetical protein SAMD00023378_3938 [Ralstonia sp. NT80]